MRVTLTLCKQHIGRMFKWHWMCQGRPIVRNSGAEEALAALNIPIIDAKDLVKQECKRERVNVIGVYGGDNLEEKLIPRHKNICYVYRDNNVLLEGLEQAKLLTKTIEMQDSFPVNLKSAYENDNLPDLQDVIQRCVLTAHVYNATQEFLPRVKDPERPMHGLPRKMGIPVLRSCSLLCTNFLRLSEALSNKSLGMMSVADSFFAVPLQKDGDSLQLEVTADLLLMSSHGLSPIADASTINHAQELPLPDLSPVKPTITLEKEKAYKISDVYPVDAQSTYSNVHTAIVYYDNEKVQNLYDTPVTEKQVLGRSLMYSFAVAAAQARRMYGTAVEDLPTPVTIQCIQTDGKLFYFSVFQLNTLLLNGIEGTRNLLWMLPAMSLFDSCCYAKSIPTLKGYNPEVFKQFLAFCVNEPGVKK